MIKVHCGRNTIAIQDNPVLFSRQCLVCRKVFTQHKRLGKRPRLCPLCHGHVTPTDHKAGGCTQCGYKFQVPIKQQLKEALATIKAAKTP